MNEGIEMDFDLDEVLGSIEMCLQSPECSDGPSGGSEESEQT
ncbi:MULTISPECIES: hypothetical protein [unclassified Chelatococcus]|nr:MULTISPECIES: hypothetical protein [unclassified Chelatococcus]